MNTMSLYFIGDIQGCDTALQRLLDTLDFSPSRDTLYLLGDLVNRGPASAQVLRRLMGLGHSARTVLGNHDLSLLALAYGARRAKRGDTLQPVLDAPDRAAMLDWLRQQPLALQEHGCLMVHAGVLPQWTTAQTLALAQEVTTVLRSSALHLPKMRSNRFPKLPYFHGRKNQGFGTKEPCLSSAVRYLACLQKHDFRPKAGKKLES